ncbi:TraB/GumN family protein [Pedobacter sp. MR2016-24]|uniref:TraB/GumN family protein n=1 Tax=Pedobacter sp. MR2016-24 TaxID=2994466 RepID=UPI002245E331|nr:TraB/GumN family protein [Pedobacter sp. MR2016-24]MCX2485523.1 TraB/GumN family protein [Pedobacter sp. MR2016-24]
MMIRKTVFSTIFSLLCLTYSQAQELQLSDNSLVWELSGKGMNNSSYIVLTTSNTCETQVSLLKKVAGIADKINVYYTESNVNDPENSKEAQKFAFVGQGDKNIADLLPAASYEKVKTKLAAMKVDEKAMISFTPFMIFNILSRSITPECNKVNQTEETFRSYALQRKYEVKSLFLLEEAFSFITAYGNDYYVQGIEDIVENEEKIKEVLKTKASLYADEEIAGIQKLYGSTFFLNSRFKNKELENKRIAMLTEKIVLATQKGAVIISIDITNVMSPEYNLFSELRKQGYTINAYK